MLNLLLPFAIFFGTTILHTFQAPEATVLASKEMSLDERYPNPFVNEVFKENILLNLAYMRGLVHEKKEIDWVKVTEPFTYTLVLKPGDVFAFHDDIESQFASSNVRTTNAHFNSQEGFKSDGYLVGDGVCHLASLIYWAAKDSGIKAVAPTAHDFAVIPQVPKEYGVSIYANPGKNDGDEKQNLYIKNDKSTPIAFVFSYEGNQLKIDVKEAL